jgi:hypothetical protein
MAGYPKKIYTIAELGRIRPEFCGCERKELLFYYESVKRKLWSIIVRVNHYGTHGYRKNNKLYWISRHL